MRSVCQGAYAATLLYRAIGYRRKSASRLKVTKIVTLQIDSDNLRTTYFASVSLRGACKPTSAHMTKIVTWLWHADFRLPNQHAVLSADRIGTRHAIPFVTMTKKSHTFYGCTIFPCAHKSSLRWYFGGLFGQEALHEENRQQFKTLKEAEAYCKSYTTL